MQARQCVELLLRGFPHSLAGSFQHYGRDFLQGCRILLTEELFGSQAVAVLDIHVVDPVPHLLVDDIGFGDVPSVGVGHDLGDLRCARCAALHHLLDVFRIEDRGAGFHADSLLEFLHFDVVAVAVVGEIGVGVLARDIAHGQVHPAHELIDVIEAQRAPGVALTGLYDGVRVVEHGPQQSGLHLSPLFVAAVHGAHVVDVGVGDLLFVGPLVAAGDHVLDAGSVHAVHTSEYPLRGHFTRVFRGYALLD